MMGINPLLDNLLVNMKGNKLRVGSHVNFQLNPRVEASAGATAPHNVHSDSRLNGEQRGIEVKLSPAALGSTPVPSTHTQLNPAAQTIAAILRHYPALEGGLKFPIPVWSENVLLSGPAFSQYMEAFFKRSGLFFESHLSRWHRGEMSPEALSQSFGSRSQRDSHFGLTLIPEEMRLSSYKERIHYIVRQQLELLTCPLLRFEGKIGDYFNFMVLMYPFNNAPQMPDILDFGQKKEEPKAIRKWRMVLRLEHSSFGYTEIEINQGKYVEVILRSPSIIFCEYASRDADRLVRSVQELGFEDTGFVIERIEKRRGQEALVQIHSEIARRDNNVNQASSMLDKHYGAESDRVLADAMSRKMPTPLIPELFPLLMNLDLDKQVPPHAFDIAALFVRWTLEQTQHVIP